MYKLDSIGQGLYSKCYRHPNKKGKVLLLSVDPIKLAMASEDGQRISLLPRMKLVSFNEEESLALYEVEHLKRITRKSRIFERLKHAYSYVHEESVVDAHSEYFINSDALIAACSFLEDVVAIKLANTFGYKEIVPYIMAIIDLKSLMYENNFEYPVLADIHLFNLMLNSNKKTILSDPLCTSNYDAPSIDSVDDHIVDELINEHLRK